MIWGVPSLCSPCWLIPAAKHGRSAQYSSDTSGTQRPSLQSFLQSRGMGPEKFFLEPMPPLLRSEVESLSQRPRNNAGRHRGPIIASSHRGRLLPLGTEG